MSEVRTEVAPPVEPTAPPVPEPTGPGTAAAAQEQLKATERPPSSLLTEGDKPAEAPKEAAPPEAFDPEKITFPEGVTKDEALFGKFSEIAKASGLTLPAAQQFADLYADAAKTSAEAFAKANQEAWNSTRTSWEAEVRENAEIAKASLKGENGTTLQGIDAIKVRVGRMLDNPALTHPNFRGDLEISALGSKLSTILTLDNYAKALGEGNGVRAGGPAPSAGSRETASQPTAARALYPNLP